MADENPKALIGHLNNYCQKALLAALGACSSKTNYEVTVEHLLLQLLDDPGADIQCILKHFGVESARLEKALVAEIESFRSGNTARPTFSPALIRWFKEAWLIASLEHGLWEMRSGVLLRALLAHGQRLCSGDYLEDLEGISREQLGESFFDLVGASSEEARQGVAEEGAAIAQAGRAEDSALARFTIDFTGQARDGAIDPIFGRDAEIRQMLDILARRRKNNPIIVGEPGVGKTALIEGLALRVVAGDVPDFLANVEILGLDLGLLQAGASVKGEFENRLKSVIAEVKSSERPIILFIDEAHTLIGAGAGAGGGDAANLLKPALARGELRTIAATTWSEYKKYFEKDAALARRFQLVKVEEPGDEDAVTMLRGLRDNYEAAHGVQINDAALVAATKMGSRYISGRQHPDKGVDLMDTAAARVKITLSAKPGSLEDLERSIQTLERELAAHRRDRDQGAADRDERIAELEAEIEARGEKLSELQGRWEREQAAAQRVVACRKQLAGEAPQDGEDDEASEDGEDGEDSGIDEKEAEVPDDQALRAELEEALAELREIQGEEPLVHTEVSADVVSAVIADWTGIPVGNMIQDEAATLLNLEERLRERIIGQDHAMDVIATGIRSSKAGLKDPDLPMGVFLFVGPSGVGKTETALGVAELMFGGERFMTTINMSEFQEKHTVSRLIGSPPGYVGYGEGGVLTEAVRQRPYSVVLLDEVEKADLEVMNLFYQVFDKGMLSDGEGRQIDFKNTVIFLTSNLATDLITQACTSGSPPDPEALSTLIRPELSHHFKPALLARMTIIPFYPIDAESMKTIARLKLGKLQRRLEVSHGMEVSVEDAAIEAIAARCTEVETGARNVDHILNGTLLPMISTAILEQMSRGELAPGLSIGLDEEGSFSLRFSEE